MIKRIFLFLLTNIAVLLVISLICSVTGADRFLTANGLNLVTLLVFSAIVGFSGSIISLLMSKTMAKRSVGAKVIEQPKNEEEAWLVETVRNLTSRANLPMPEVAIYEGAPNAFATGCSKAHSLVAVSTGLLRGMNRSQIEAVLGHEVTHVANGDMVTLTLIQGVVNTFVVFLSRVLGFIADSFVRGDDDSDERSAGGVYYIVSVICQVLFGFLATMVVCYFSRKREFAADAGSANLLGSPKQMVEALKGLGSLSTGGLPKSMATSGIAGARSFMELFSTHPPLEVRIAALEKKF